MRRRIEECFRGRDRFLYAGAVVVSAAGSRISHWLLFSPISVELPEVRLITEENGRQPGDYTRKDRENNQSDKLEQDKGNNTPVDMPHGVPFRRHAFKIEQRVAKAAVSKKRSAG